MWLSPGERQTCSDLFPVEHYIQLQAQSSILTHDELDLTLIGSIMCTVIQDSYVRDGRHKPSKKRKKQPCHTCIMPMKYAKTYLCFTWHRERQIEKHQGQLPHYNGLETRVHGNTKRVPHSHLAHAVITNVTKFLENYTEENAILLPGRIPGYKQHDIKLLPSSCSKKV